MFKWGHANTGVEVLEFEIFCEPTNQEDCNEALPEVKKEPKDDFKSAEAWVEEMIKQDEG